MNNINPTYEQKVYALANMDDKMLRKTAQYQAYYQQRAYSNPKNDKYIKALIWGLPVVDSLFVAHAAEGQLGNKSFAFGKHMLNWVGIFALGYLLNIADKKLMQKIPAYEEFENNHPGIALIKDLAVFYGLYIGMGKVSKKAGEKINLKSSKIINKITTQTDKLKKSIDASFLNKKIFKPISENMNKFSLKHPKISSVGRLGVLVPLAFMIGILGKVMSDKITFNDLTEENYYKLKEMQIHAQNAINTPYMNRAMGETRDYTSL